MYPVSNQFLQSLRTSGRRKTVADIYALYGGGGVQLLANGLDVVSGTISCDRNASVARTLSIEIAATGIDPLASTLFLPYGNEIVVRQGISYSDASSELVPLGWFTIETLTWEDTAKGQVLKITGSDRSANQQRASYGFPEDYSGQLLQTAVSNVIVKSGWTDGAYSPIFSAGLRNPKLPPGSTYDGSRWDAVQKLCESISAEPRFDVDGVLRVKPIPVITDSTALGAAVWTVDTGANGVLVKAERSITRQDTYNNIVVVGAPVDEGIPQAFGQATDLDPKSPTYANGPFRRVTNRIENAALISNAQCLALAQAKLADMTALSYSVNITSLPNPALDLGDIILVEFASGDRQLHLVDSMSIPLGSGDFTITTKTAYRFS